MRLKSLKLAGFKSFANPTTFTFRHGITAIVGPNGCGKSNVIDAIRWVLGESSAKQLRGGAMSDVIFAGTESKSAKSLASVELTFQHTQDEQTGIRHELNIYHELSVRRQINADGKSDYFINGTRCRRRDVVDVFLGTGLGPRSYSVIQQGMIGRIVDSSPLQLREFIEEAAGVSRYQARREETQKKLLKTRENLDRLTDIESELTRQKQKLAKQADNATQYQHIKDELDHVKEQLVTYQLYEAKAAQLEHKEAQKTLEKSVTELQQDDAKLRQKLTKSAERLSEEQWLKDQARDNLHEQDMQRQQVEHKRTTLQTSLNQLESRLQTNIEKQQYTQESIAEAEQENETQSANVSRLSPQLDKLKQQQKQRQAQYGPLQAALESNKSQVAKVETEKRELEQQIALGQQAYKRLQLDQDKWQSRDNAWAQEAAKWGLAGEQNEGISADDRGASGDMSSASIDAQIAELDKALSGLDKQQESIDDSLDIEQPALKKRQASLNEQQAKFAALEKQHASLMAEYETLHAIVHPKKKQSSTESKPADTKSDASVSGTTSVDSALQSLKPLHQQIKLTKAGEAHASALDQWLAFWLDARVFDTADSSDDALNNLLADLLTSRSDGLNTNATSDKKNNKKANKQSKEQTQANSVFYATKGNALEGADKEAATALLNDYPELKALSQLIAAPKLDIWQRVYLYTGSELTQDDAKHLIKALPKQSILLTPAGWIMSHVGAIHLSKLGAGSQNEQFLSVKLQQTQRLAELEEALNDIEAEIETLDKSIKADSAKQEQAAIFVEELTAQLAALTHKRHEIKQQRVELAAKQERQRSEQTRLKQQRTELDTERQEIEQELIALTKKEAEYKERLEALEPLLTAAKEKQQQLEQERVENNQKERDDNDAMRQLQLEFSQAELGSKHSHQQIKQLTKDIERLKQAHKRLIEERETANAELPKLDTELKKMNASYHEMKVALDERNAIITALQTEVNEQQAKRDALSLELTQRQEKLANSVTQVAIADERINEASERLKVLNAEANPVALINDYVANGRRVPDEDVQKLQEQEKQLTHKLENMGPVNLAAVAELEAVDERLLPLEQQINDITASMEKLTEAIASIDTKTKALFTETLNSVNKSLNSLFTKVFNGGQASLTLVKDDTLEKGEQWRAGLELMAQPKGKRNSRLAVLSGGEKTLTALSLIFAIFKQHPAPFCVLDEVDAPLDDANVARFTSLIAELADDVQFIFISHNKLAMQIADELKGITMPQAGISTLVSVSLEEAEQYLEPTA